MSIRPVLTVVVPCYNEEATLAACVERVESIESPDLALQVIIVDDCSVDRSCDIAHDLATRYQNLTVVRHETNQGKGAALRTGFGLAAGDFVAVQDADLEYDPKDLLRLVLPLIADEADVVFGSRFVTGGAHRVLYFWHFVANWALTLLSNMFTDLNLTDMETCYKVFKREVIQQVEIRENRFGFEPEIVARVAHLRVRIYEMGISYHARTYEEGKKIGAIDGLRALYCIVRYNASRCPLPLQFVVYSLIGAVAAVANLLLFLGAMHAGATPVSAAAAAFVAAALLNYVLCIALLFRHRARWNSLVEFALFLAVVAAIGTADVAVTSWLIRDGLGAALAKSVSSVLGLVLNFAGRRFIVFPEPPSGPWHPQGRAPQAVSIGD